MRKRWLWLMAALAVLGLCSCKGGSDGKTAALREGTAAENTAEDGRIEEGEGEGKDGGTQAKTGDAKDREEDGKDGGKNREFSEEVTGDGEEKPEPAGIDGSEDSGKEMSPGNGDFRTGTWDGLVFTNSWLGVAIPFPEGTYVFSEEEMRSMVGESDAIAVNGGDWEAMKEKTENALNIYDFMATMPNGSGSVQLAYMNAAKVDPSRDISAADCLEEMAEELSSIKDMGYEVGAVEKVQLGGKTFDRFTASLMGGALYQEYYGIRVGDYVAILTASYEEDGRAAVEEMTGGIRRAP